MVRQFVWSQKLPEFIWVEDLSEFSEYFTQFTTKK